MAVVEEYHFELNANAKNLKQQRGTCILMIVRGTFNELFSTLEEHIQSLAADSRYPLFIHHIDENENEVTQAIKIARERKPLGILFLGGNSQHFAAAFEAIHVPAVVVTHDTRDLNFPNLSSVSTDDRAGGFRAVEHLICSGHKHIAVLGSDRLQSDTSMLRFLGCQEAFHKYGIEFDESCYRTGRYSYASGYESMSNLLQAHPEITAVFAMADVIAIGAIRTLRDMGKRVSEDISVIGYDGLRLGDYFIPKLTSIVQQAEPLAKHSFSLLLNCIEQ